MNSDKKIFNILLNAGSLTMPNIIELLNSNKGLLKDFINYSNSNKQYAWRAAWIIYHYTLIHKSNTIQNNINDFIQALRIAKKDGHKREILKIINTLELNESQKFEVYDICISLIWNNKSQSSLRHNATLFALKVADLYPELTREIKNIYDDIKENLSPGVKNSLNKKFKAIKIAN